ncbi:YncE family protein [Clostridium magnum]|uniref:6-phosphogluconolactonase n=1 Tax=Clostridium magnum DSM 2767 TaxID=1121326 RepID=A0A161Y460_9CLOT|nr:YncE family protein [Clostridium magnum]KZL92909.1 6-phosphogluconolactonase [Clostridium magnum DSM 2767]SHJ15927.1 40-residue YVTN family beta-propeller repeat-containing protein [Clostridium magnum DSM 2767]
MENTMKSSWKGAVFPYIVYVMFFLGMGLTSGSIVHMPLDPHKYTIVLFVGMGVFVVASLLNEIVIDKKNLSIGSTIRLVIFSLCLSVGIGMISGGIQHFDDVAEYAAYLIPGGIILSFTSFLLKNNIKLGIKKGLPLFAVVLTIALFLSFALKNVAANMPKGEGHSHSHGEEEELKSSVNLENAPSSSVSSNTSYYFTANEEGSISKIDTLTNRILATIKVEGSIHNVQMSPDNKILAATLMPKNVEHDDHGSAHGHGVVLFYNAETNGLIAKVSAGNHPAHVVFTNDGKYVLATNSDKDNVIIIDAKSYQVVKTVQTEKGPHGFRISKDSKYAYVANYDSDSISIIDINEAKVTKTIKVGKNPVTTAITDDNKTLLATVSSENVVAVVDLATNNVEKVKVGEVPAQVYIQKDNKYAFVANQGTENKPSNSITKIDLSTKKVIETIEVGKGAHGIVVSDDNKFVYVTNMYDNTVSVIDNSKNKVIAIIPVGKNPNGITYKN